jgi:hypothetical protein
MNLLGVDSYKRRAKRLAERPKCGMLWENYQGCEESHFHKCKRASRHTSVHTCHCGAQRRKKP